MNLLRRVRRDDRGITIVETVIASGLFLVILLAVLATLDSGARTERISQARQKALVDLRQSMTQMTKELRQATAVDPSSTATHLDIQTLIGGVPHHVVYDVANTPPNAVLQRSVDGGTPVTLATRVVAPHAFCYQYDEPTCLRETPDPATLSSVRISLTLDPVVFSSGSVTLATDVDLRNITHTA